MSTNWIITVCMCNCIDFAVLYLGNKMPKNKKEALCKNFGLFDDWFLYNKSFIFVLNWQMGIK